MDDQITWTDNDDESSIRTEISYRSLPSYYLRKSSRHKKKNTSAVSSQVSMKSDQSKDDPPNLSALLRSLHQKKSTSTKASQVSMKSDWSMGHPPNLSVLSLHLPFDIVESEMHSLLYRKRTFDERQTRLELKTNLAIKFKCLFEGTAMEGNPTLLNEIYTELYITESESGEISNEHEVRQIETQSRRLTREDTPIKCRDIFRPLPGQDKAIRTVLTQGVAGIGKTVSVQKFILDWAEEKENQNIQFIFPLPFREINLMKEKTLSLSDLLHIFFPETREIKIFSEQYKMLFIFDGLDECRLPLDFQSNVRLCDVNESASVDVLLTNLISGNLLPSALIWITSRPAAADLIPSKCVHRVTEVRGFNDPQKEEYFRKRISGQSLANTIISHLKSSRSLYTMCHVPVFCWISATVLEKMLSGAEGAETPKTLTQMYTHFLILQINIKHQKDYEKNMADVDMILKLGKVAFQQLLKGNVIFYEEDLRECGIDVTEASVYSGLCSQIFREEFGLSQGKVFTFVHLSVQEHLAALYVHLSFTNNNRNVFDERTNLFFDDLILCEFDNCLEYCMTDMQDLMTLQSSVRLQALGLHEMFQLHRKAVDEALHSKNGLLDLFLRFLLGLSVKSNQILLKGLFSQNQPKSSPDNSKKTTEYIKKIIRTTCSPEKSINLFHCLNELGDNSLVEEIQQYLRSGRIKNVKLSSSQWSAVVFAMLTSEKKLDEFKLNDFVGAENKADHILQKLLPVVKESRKAELSDCGLTNKCCPALALALRSNPGQLRELSLSGTNIGDSGMKSLSPGLGNYHCKLEILRLSRCGISSQGCSALASALRSNPSHLRELDLSRNNLRDSGVKSLFKELQNPDCKLEILQLSNCGITIDGCAALASALIINPEHLRELDLSQNTLGDTGCELLTALLKSESNKLEKLLLHGCLPVSAHAQLHRGYTRRMKTMLDVSGF